MPEVDGIEAAKMIRSLESPTGEHIPMIALTAFALQGDKERFLAMGMDEYISKPVKISELYEKIESLCGPDNIPVNLADIEINQDGEAVVVENGAIPSGDEAKAAIREMEAYIYKLELAIAQQDISEIEKISHQIKSISSSIDVYDIKNSAFRIELAARRGNVEAFEGCAEQLIREYETLAKSINKLEE